MPSATYTLFVCSYDGRARELCPHTIGTNKRGEEVVLAWNSPEKAQARCRNGGA